MSDGARSVLSAYRWPGNVRELQNICERAAVLAPGDTIEADLIAPWLGGPAPGPVAPALPAAPERAGVMIEPRDAAVTAAAAATDIFRTVCDGETTLEDVERETIIATLIHHNGHRQKSAAALGIGVRTLGLKLKKWKEQKLVAQTL